MVANVLTFLMICHIYCIYIYTHAFFKLMYVYTYLLIYIVHHFLYVSDTETPLLKLYKFTNLEDLYRVYKLRTTRL